MMPDQEIELLMGEYVGAKSSVRDGPIHMSDSINSYDSDVKFGLGDGMPGPNQEWMAYITLSGQNEDNVEVSTSIVVDEDVARKLAEQFGEFWDWDDELYVSD